MHVGVSLIHFLKMLGTAYSLFLLYSKKTTLNMIFSVTYYLTLCNAIIVYCTSLLLFTNKGRIGCLDIIEH